VGHAGTLDPLATGVLVVAMGAATRLIELVQQMGKTYEATIRLGAWSDTDDADGVVTELEPPAVVPGPEQVEAVLQAQVGTIWQQPPRYSALKVDGRRAYDLARQGETPELSPRPVRIDRIAWVAYAWPELRIVVDCGAGTYIRSIARDVGEALGSGGLITRLCRTRIGEFTLEEAIDPASLTSTNLGECVQPMARAVAGLPRVEVTAEQATRLGQGQALDVARLPAPLPHDLAGGARVALFGPAGTLVALGRVDGLRAGVRPERVLSPVAGG
jgi:tRNA pseudouridine55 synthase